MSSSVAFVTGHEDPAKIESSVDWELLARGVDTLVIFMGVSGAAEIAGQLMAHGLGADTPAAVIRWGTYEHQECHVAALAELANLIETRAIKAPAIIVIGEVVGLREKLNWFDSAAGYAKVFNTKGQRIKESNLAPSTL